MRLKISTSSNVFFELFSRSATNLREAAELLQDLASDYRDVELKARRIQEREHEGDTITHEVIQRLNTMFITPMDREDIYTLATALDDVVDLIEEAADSFVLHNIAGPRASMVQQADLLAHAAQQTEQALATLPSLDRSRLEPYWIEINRLENEGDRIFRRAVAEMFSGDFKAMDVLKWKDVIENLEEAIDGLENVANLIESIVLKHA